MQLATEMRDRLTAAFAPSRLEVIDESEDHLGVVSEWSVESPERS